VPQRPWSGCVSNTDLDVERSAHARQWCKRHKLRNGRYLPLSQVTQLPRTLVLIAIQASEAMRHATEILRVTALWHASS
jgi:hypothetical protein